jgi:hypothetical protein
LGINSFQELHECGKEVVATAATNGNGFEMSLEVASRGIIIFHYTKVV